MFSTIHNQSKANELIERAKKIIEDTKERIREAKEKLLEEASKNDSIKEQLNKKGLNRFQKLAQELKNEPSVEIAPVSMALFIEQIEPLIKQSDTEPPQIVELKQKKGSALFTAFFATLTTIALAILVGAFATGVSFMPETFTDIKVLENILAWIGGGAVNPEIANPIWGAVGLAAVALAVGALTWSMTLSSTSKKNLEISESLLMDAESFDSEINEVIKTMQNLTQALQDYRKNIEICDAYINEYNAVIHRILVTEGDDYETFKPSSKAHIERASVTVSAIIPYLNIAIITTENKTADQLLQAIDDTKKLVQNLIEEKPISTM